MESFSDKLKSLGFKVASDIKTVSRSRVTPIEEIISGKIISNSLGEFIVREEIFPIGYKHGLIDLNQPINDNHLTKAAKVTNDEQKHNHMVFIDTETTGLAGGTGTLAFLVGAGQFTEEGFVLNQFLVRNPSEEPAMLLHLSNHLSLTERVVSFNGKSFDIPLLNTRYKLQKMDSPFSDLAHIDLLHISRKLWKQRLPSRTLQDLEREILDLPRSDEEVPGWMIPEIYFEYLRSGDASKIKNVIYHNAIDIVSLAALYSHISSLLENNVKMENTHLIDLFAIGNVLEDSGEIILAEKVYSICLMKVRDNQDLALAISKRIGYLYKKNDSFQKALPYLVKTSLAGDINSCIDLAKYYEHMKGDFENAMLFSLKAQELIEKSDYTLTSKTRLKEEIQVRLTRLKRKAKKNV